MSENISYINKDNYDASVKGAEYAVVDFYSTECPPCEALAPKFDSLAALYGHKVKFFKIFPSIKFCRERIYPFRFGV